MQRHLPLTIASGLLAITCVATVHAQSDRTALENLEVIPFATIARVRPGSINVMSRPAPDAPVTSRIRRISTRTGEAVGFLVTDSTTGEDGGTWLQVNLPGRPNGSMGWIPGALTTLEHASTRITVSLSRRTLVLTRDGIPRLTIKIVVGKPSTPTPTGSFAVWDSVRLDTGIYAPAVLPITAHSAVLSSFNGADARVAIHGMNGSLAVPPGTARSNGCIRVPPRFMRAIANYAIPGTPVEITP